MLKNHLNYIIFSASKIFQGHVILKNTLTTNIFKLFHKLKNTMFTYMCFNVYFKLLKLRSLL